MVLLRASKGHRVVCCSAPEIGEALKRFVDKDEKQSLHDTFDHILSTTKQAALEDLATAGMQTAWVGDRAELLGQAP